MYTTLVDTQTLKAHLDDPAWVVVDCRFDLMRPDAGMQEYRHGHIPGARYADLNRHLSAPMTPRSGRHPLPDPASFARQAGAWGIGQASQVVVYDASHGAYAARLWWMLRWLGHQSVALLDGGWNAWLNEDLPVSAEIPLPDAVVFPVNTQAQGHVSMSQMQQHLRDGAVTVLDARAAARYAGEVEPIDPVAGHIPGALSFPFEANLDDRGHFLSAQNLKHRFQAFAEQPQQVVHMCGSGVTACHNLLAMEIAGLHGSKLYAGSWSEWVRNPGNPVGRGRDA